MNRRFAVPGPLHDVLGRTQTPAELGTVLLVAAGLSTVLCLEGAAVLSALPWWRALLAVLLVVDVAAGCVANFTTGTDAHYARRPTSRWVFILVHWHLVLLGALLGLELAPLLLLTAGALLAAAAVTLLRDHRLHVTAGGALTAVGVVAVVLWLPASTPSFVVATAALFVVKVVLAFAVTHHDRGEAPSGPQDAW